MIFPRANAPFFLAAATTQVTSSGREVPQARMVIATNFSDNPAERAISHAESTNMSPPKISPPKPPSTIKIANHIFFSEADSPTALSSVASVLPVLNDISMYNTKSTRNTMPIQAEIVSLSPRPRRVWLIPNRIRRSVTIILTGMSRLLFSGDMATGLTNAVSPKIRNTLNMFDPTTLPIAMSALPFSAPVKLTTNSGMEVPMPTMVIPIRNSLKPALRAIADAPSTNKSAPMMTRARPARRIKIERAILILPERFS